MSVKNGITSQRVVKHTQYLRAITKKAKKGTQRRAKEKEKREELDRKKESSISEIVESPKGETVIRRRLKK